MGKINVLDFEIANLIAAGEVVERPSSVMKELIENSIDSGATEIVAEIKRGGVSLIRVSDNGCGMEKEERKRRLRMRLQRLSVRFVLLIAQRTARNERNARRK